MSVHAAIDNGKQLVGQVQAHLGPRVGWGGVDNPTELHVHVFAGADGRFTLYEDDGETTAYRDGAFVLSRFEQRWSDTSVRLSLAGSACERSLLPDGRLAVAETGAARMVLIDPQSGSISAAGPPSLFAPDAGGSAIWIRQSLE